MGECCSSTDVSREGDAKIEQSKQDVVPTVNKENSSQTIVTENLNIVFDKVSKQCGINDNALSAEYIEQLNKLWYYRAIDKETWDKLKMPMILHDQLFTYIENCKQNKLFIEFKEPISKHKNIKQILIELKTENKSHSTFNDIQLLEKTLDTLYLLNVDKLKMYLEETDWNNINVPEYLKTILLQKIRYKFEGRNNNQLINNNCDVNKGENDPLFEDVEELKYDLQKATERGYNNKKNEKEKDNIDPTCTLSGLCDILANSLFTDSDRIKNDLKVFFDYRYKRIYHLSKISDDIFNKFVSEKPKCLRMELFHIITKCRQKTNLLPFFDYKFYNNNSNIGKKRKSVLEWTMTSDKVFELLEKDMNLQKSELSNDCDLLMSSFYSNLWDLFFVPDSFWKTMPYYNSYEIVRIRINELMNVCVKKYNINKNKIIPVLPELWIKKYSEDLSVEQILFGSNNKEFSFDGLDWNENTVNKIKLINEYMHKNYIGKLQFVSREHAKHNDIWTKYINDNEIPHHIRFKINFYSIKGNIQTNDDWLNNYIKTNYPNFPSQYNQIILPDAPVFSVENISDTSAKLKFSIQCESECYVEIMDEDEKDTKWDQFATFKNQTSYLCEKLKPNNSYQIRTRYRNQFHLSACSQIISFKTMAETDKWDKQYVGNGISINGNIIEFHGNICIYIESTGNVRVSTAVLLSKIVSEGIHVWTFKVHKCNTNWCLIGVCKQHLWGNPNTYFTNGHYGVAYAIGNGCITNNRWDQLGKSYSTHYGKTCNAGDIVKMKVDFKSRAVSYNVNGIDYGKAFSIDNTKYKAAICCKTGDKLESMEYERIQ